MRVLLLILAVVAAVLVHAGILAFGGALFMHDDAPTVREIELLGAEDPTVAEEKVEPEPTPEDPIEQQQDEPPPDASEIVKSMEQLAAPNNDAPALEAASLSAIEAALNGGGAGAGGDFAGALSLSSGGRIGGTGVAGTSEESIEEAFSLAEIDQKPRAVYQSSANYPTELKGKRVEGAVSVIFIVDANGRVQNPRAVSSSQPAFEKPALESVRQWKFEAAVKGGERVACRMRVSVRFQPT